MKLLCTGMSTHAVRMLVLIALVVLYLRFLILAYSLYLPHSEQAQALSRKAHRWFAYLQATWDSGISHAMPF